MSVPRGIVRLRFDQGFPLDAAVGLVDHFADLGLSHLAASPVLASRPGLPAGVVDHDAIAPRLGGEEALRRLATALRRRGMGLILDIAPAFMAVGADDNAAWRDLLEWGRDGARAHWFDVDWRGTDPTLRNKVLVPFLDRPYGEVLAAGGLQLAFEASRGAFLVRHRDHTFPISPLDYATVLEASGLSDAVPLAAPFTHLPRLRPDAEQAEAARRALAEAATSPEGRAIVTAAAGAFDPRIPGGAARMHRLLERQAYRLAWWGTAADALNWSRHPRHGTLAAIRVERPDVFDATHATLLRLYGEALVDGFVIRQWDLLADPIGYARRLRLKLETAAGQRPAGLPAPYLVAAAAPAGGMPPVGWGVAGTAGAEAQDALSAVLHDPAGGTPLSDIWISTTGERQRFDDLRAATRRQALDALFGARLDAAVLALHEVAAADSASRDTTPAAIRRVACELAVALPARRTHAGLDGFDETDAALFAAALARARRRLSPLDQPAAERIAGWLGGEAPRAVGDFEQAGAREHAIALFQQLTAALDRVATDEMLLSRYGRLISRNETGSDPTLMGLAPEAFHARMAARRARCPDAVTATSGPGRRLGEDARMRLAVLSAAPRVWDEMLRGLMDLSRPLRARLAEGVAPAPADAAVLFQGVLAAWPPALRPDDALGLGDLHDRLRAWWLKGLRDARLRTGPECGDPGYEAAGDAFLSALVEGPEGLKARGRIAAIVPRLARAGMINALSQVVLKCTVPGIPELFQGTEFWDYSLGETDAARASDHLARGTPAADARPDLLLDSAHDGRVKQATLARLLRLRAAEPALFREGEYLPLTVEGPNAGHILAFARRLRGATLVTVVTRLAFGLLEPGAALPRVSPERWAGTRAALPAGGSYRDALTGRSVDAPEGHLDLAVALADFPAAVLIKA
ncbi:malto-oligosyltrehalose synthase [Xanthobacter sp. V2C-8]|uniref:malto-oligosyltrehalose synthase n=1 Tax=Xanthobacter albus TaxID=3119929 RepID=UPI003729C16D